MDKGSVRCIRIISGFNYPFVWDYAGLLDDLTRTPGSYV